MIVLFLYVQIIYALLKLVKLFNLIGKKLIAVVEDCRLFSLSTYTHICRWVLQTMELFCVFLWFETAIQSRLQMAMEVRDSLEVTHTGEYLNFLRFYFRAFSMILNKITKPQFVDNPEHKIRNIVVEILNRLPHSEVLRPFVQDLLKVAMHVLTTDNEENGLICIRIIFDLLRNFRPTLENEVQPFLDFVCKIYQNFRLTVTHFFENGDMAAASVSSSSSLLSASTGTFGSIGGEDKLMDVSDQMGPPTGYVGSGQLNPSTLSFKIVTETPLVVMFLFQLYSRLVQTNIPHLLPLMVAAISVTGPEKVPPHLKSHFVELKGAQVKVSAVLHIIFHTVIWKTPTSLFMSVIYVV